MRLLRNVYNLPDDIRGAVIVIGNFDGLHKGHQEVIAAAREVADKSGGPLVMMTFSPHPQRFFQPDGKPFRLTPFRAKVRAIAELGIDILLVCRFDKRLSSLSAEEFLESILYNGIGASHVVVGHDFTFGKQRLGNPELLKLKSKKYGFNVTIVSPQKDVYGVVYSSSIIRSYLNDGFPEKAAATLGRLWEIEGRVMKGDQRGRTIGFPTANIDPIQYVQPALGVYAIRVGVKLLGNIQWFDGVANLGIRPTVYGDRILLESHLFDFEADLYEKYLRIAFVAYIRPEEKFKNLDALKTQISIDSKNSRKILSDFSLKSTI